MVHDLISRAEEHPKGWGRELWIANNPLYCGKILEVKKGKRCSIHYHKRKDETFYILSGRVQMKLHPKGYPGQEQSFIMREGDILHLTPGMIHQFEGITDSRILEVSTEHFEDDSYRLLRGD